MEVGDSSVEVSKVNLMEAAVQVGYHSEMGDPIEVSLAQMGPVPMENINT